MIVQGWDKRVWGQNGEQLLLMVMEFLFEDDENVLKEIVIIFAQVRKW